MTLYTKQTWTNGAGGNTPISAARLGHMETGIQKAAEEVTELMESVPGSFSEFSNVTIVMYLGSWPARPTGLPVNQHVLWVNPLDEVLPPAGVGGYDPDLDLALTALTGLS